MNYNKHIMNCNACGQEIDMRNLSQVFAHEPCEGIVDYETMEKITQSGSIKIGEPIYYTNDIGNINKIICELTPRYKE